MIQVRTQAAYELRPSLFWDVTHCRLTDVSGRSISPIFEGQVVQEDFWKSWRFRLVFWCEPSRCVIIRSGIYLFIYLFMYLFIYLFICLFIYLFIYLFIFYLFIYLFIYLCIYLFMYVCIYLFMYLCIYLFIYYLFIYFAVALRPNAGHGLLILEVSRSHTTTHYSR